MPEMLPKPQQSRGGFKRMKNLYVRVFLLSIFGIVLAGTVIFFTTNIHTAEQFFAFRLRAVIPAVLFMFLGMYFDGSRLIKLVKIYGKRITFFQAMQVILSNYFLSLLTPGATGGPVAQIYFLRQMGIEGGQATVIVFVRTILSILFLVVAVPVVCLFDTGLIPWISQQTLAILISSLLFFILVGVCLVCSKRMQKLLMRIAMQLSWSLRRRAWKFISNMRVATQVVLRSPGPMLKVFIETALSLIALYSIVPALFLGFNCHMEVSEWLIILGRMIFLNLVLYVAPSPGGVGIAEIGFVYLYKEFVPSGMAGIIAVYWRIIAEYLPFAAGMYFSLRRFGKDILHRL